MAELTKLSKIKITHANIRMYRMGTGDCFIIKFFRDKTTVFTMMIDCGTWQGTKAHLTTFITNLKEYVAEDSDEKVPTIDVLVVTHEHKDHVYGFDACSNLFINTVNNPKNFIVKKIWMGWTENDGPTLLNDPLRNQVQQWKDEHGQRKKALKATANKLNELFRVYKKKEPEKLKGLAAIQSNFASALDQFADLHFSAHEGIYAGELEGMRIVKKEIAKNNISYLRPGDIIDNLLDGVRFYVLGPPTSIESIKTESGPEGETFSHSHNTSRAFNDAFATAILNLEEPQSPGDVLPFDNEYIIDEKPNIYTQNEWRSIDHDWLNSAGSLALRMNSATNNLSLAFAIEFVESERVLLFPGDAEYGSWASWHKIPWKHKGKDGKKHLTEDLLNRTVFYKVAHHLSHNGTAKRCGVEMMTHPDLVAMATLDYNVISKGWKNTMPNNDLVIDLLTRTKGRLIIMNENELTLNQSLGKVPLSVKILETRNQLMNDVEKNEFKNALEVDELYLQFKVKT